ncbi:Nas2p [Saccharomyces cerevisiae x Saccharomyces kudriavzevii VIN7]|uniref:Probable 26S proteasome regulatory subunit p27 n=1 Tax=Saccharomyces cerevisiae x Saccharomyces kudriavzevii (strain VIN7) TaxID=1095631 RepID=H0GWE5_SACCK|nr:Nas2p [Saccharomyces cerevisiae x Saccharomyces kudriavzevii VIN7]
MAEKDLSDLLANVKIDPSLTSRMSQMDNFKLPELMVLKTDIEAQLEAYFGLLEEQGIGMDSPLVTPDGYPRSDVDVLQITMIRKNVNMLKNDLNHVLQKSHVLLNQHFDNMNVKTHQKTNDNGANSGDQPVQYAIPFAFISEVVPGSPSDKAGIQINDKLISIGSVHAANHSKLQNIQAVVIKNEEKPLPVRLLRDGQILTTSLSPSRCWNGKGLLGCRIQEL